MSSLQESDYELQAERAADLERQRRLAAMLAETAGLMERIQSLLNQTAAGLQTPFSQQVASASRWLRQVREQVQQGVGAESESELEPYAAAGRAHLTTLTVAFTQTASAMGRALAREIATLEELLIGNRELIERWQGKEMTSRWETRLADAGRRLRRQDFSRLADALQETRREIRQQAEQAEHREQLQQKRLYLLIALRQVCADLGFQEVGGPRYENPGRRDGRIRFEVDTLDRGHLVFLLSLDGIQSNSLLADRHCFDQFDQLSQSLAEQFGIRTNFRPVAEKSQRRQEWWEKEYSGKGALTESVGEKRE